MLDLADEIPEKEKDQSLNNVQMESSVNWDPFSQGNDKTNAITKTTSLNDNSNTKQPDLFDLVYTDQLPNTNPNKNDQNLGEIFTNTTINESDERQKKKELFE